MIGFPKVLLFFCCFFLSVCSLLHIIQCVFCSFGCICFLVLIVFVKSCLQIQKTKNPGPMATPSETRKYVYTQVGGVFVGRRPPAWLRPCTMMKRTVNRIKSLHSLAWSSYLETGVHTHTQKAVFRRTLIGRG